MECFEKVYVRADLQAVKQLACRNLIKSSHPGFSWTLGLFVNVMIKCLGPGCPGFAIDCKQHHPSRKRRKGMRTEERAGLWAGRKTTEPAGWKRRGFPVHVQDRHCIPSFPPASRSLQAVTLLATQPRRGTAFSLQQLTPFTNSIGGLSHLFAVAQLGELRALFKKQGFISFWACLGLGEPTGRLLTWISLLTWVWREGTFSQERVEVQAWFKDKELRANLYSFYI